MEAAVAQVVYLLVVAGLFALLFWPENTVRGFRMGQDQTPKPPSFFSKMWAKMDSGWMGLTPATQGKVVFFLAGVLTGFVIIGLAKCSF